MTEIGELSTKGKRMRRLSLLLLALGALLLSGCATSYDRGLQALNRGDLANAEQLLTQAIQNGVDVGPAWYSLGVVYYRRAQYDKSMQTITLAARYGEPTAQKYLLENGRAVPTADLARTDGKGISGAEALLLLTGSAVDGYNKGRQSQPAPLPKTINCTSTTSGRTTETACR